MSISLLLVVLTGAAAFASPPASSTAKLQNVNFGAFTQTATYSIANQLGFFTAYGINVTYLQVPNSTYGYDQLLNGGYDIMTGTIDNAVNLRFNQNKSLAVPGQLDGGPELTIASIPSIKRIPELKGKSLMVDSPVSGYAYILRKVLSLYGLRLENGDYDFQIVGSTVLRYADLVNGSLPNGTAVYATIFTYPFTSEAKGITGDKHPNILASISDFIQPFSSSAFTVREDALANQTERALMRKFIAAMYTANKYLADPSHKESSSAYISATDPLSGETSSPGGNFTVNRQGLLNVIDVRNHFDGFTATPNNSNFADAILPGPGKLIDYSLRDEAIESVIPFIPNTQC